MVAGCALETAVSPWMVKKKVNMVQGQQDGPLNGTLYTLYILHRL